ncbi:uncharacterized protein CELE_ZK180.8 [Caenorhabditis elegans]|uniref:Uncharacterized protein n=1 Tax=Caenorhabditis elegans TaxID=6239 RepID=U4PRK1_CAEEL|nr:Uncharacterized protein CELE_ZK180.8 [Caenorhabditis elegans]CDH93206.1 Uncharacterized protein CELE_ZK180.8 [Caenorhabditis elegans]|eukprot:NP_001294436.1 Uncharacterized protein CELE_ZK180.8 [Caenorhabditis elegans]
MASAVHLSAHSSLQFSIPPLSRRNGVRVHPLRISNNQGREPPLFIEF